MARYVVLLRGVNVGGHNKVPMADFRALLEGQGLTDVATYLQSGNAVFTTTKRGPSMIAAGIETAMIGQLGVDVRALVVPRERLQRIIDNNPMAQLDDDPTHLHVAFLSAKPQPGVAKNLDTNAFAPDRFEVAGDVLYLYYPNGMGRSKLDPGKVAAQLGLWATARNWRTVTQLHELVAS